MYSAIVSQADQGHVHMYTVSTIEIPWILKHHVFIAVHVYAHVQYVWHIRSDIENCEGWLSSGGHSSGGRALTGKVRGPRFNPGWLPVFYGSLKIFPNLSSCTYTTSS